MKPSAVIKSAGASRCNSTLRMSEADAGTVSSSYATRGRAPATCPMNCSAIILKEAEAIFVDPAPQV